jgi:hypothetical protein
MNEPAWTSQVRQEEWSLEMIFRWLEETAAFLHEIESHRRQARRSEPESFPEGATRRGDSRRN